MIAGTERSDVAHETGFRRVIRRNNSLSSTGRLVAFALIFIVSIGIAVAFATFGAWLILPFAGLEMLVLFIAFRYMERHAADYELIEIDGDTVKVEWANGGTLLRGAFNRHWAQVVSNEDGSRIALRSHGRELEIGRYMNDEQRLDLARALKRRLHAAG
ncbi:MAG TPA: DUF2244 domain-containing protein [Burkholderiales bacterium]|nr:DUF2244 domain-containing protein [Burkholderiales bacterium]